MNKYELMFIVASDLSEEKREELIAKLAGCLLANVSKLAATLDAVRVKKEEEAK